MTEEDSQHEKKIEKSPENPFFRLVILVTGFFVFTLLVLVATFLGDPNNVVNRLIQKFAGSLITAEVAAILIVGFLALYLDHRDQTDIEKPTSEESPEKPAEEPHLSTKSPEESSAESHED